MLEPDNSLKKMGTLIQALHLRLPHLYWQLMQGQSGLRFSLIISCAHNLYKPHLHTFLFPLILSHSEHKQNYFSHKSEPSCVIKAAYQGGGNEIQICYTVTHD